MALQEKLDRFKRQQERCQTTLSGIAASKTTTTTPRFTPAPAASRPPAPAIKFSNDTERLQHINSIRKSPVGAQIKRVIDLLLEVHTYRPSFLFPPFCFLTYTLSALPGLLCSIEFFGRLCIG